MIPLKIKIKSVLKGLTPPRIWELFRLLREKNNQFIISPYSTWEESQLHCSGYDADLILDNVKKAMLQVKEGKAGWEQDSFLLEKGRYSFPLLAALLRVSLLNSGALNILDFGGSLGSSYYKCRGFLTGVKTLRWNIIEQEKFVDCGKEMFANSELSFYYSIEECLESEKPQVALLSSVLQYLKNPYQIITKLQEYNISHIIIDRTPFVENGNDLLCIQKVPKEIYDASLPHWILNRINLCNYLQEKYVLIDEFDAFDGSIRCRGINADYKGLIYDRKGK
jgi:putative methyltransferase (TIGR04325 family)